MSEDLFVTSQIRVKGFDAPLGSPMVRITCDGKEAVLMLTEIDQLANKLLEYVERHRRNEV